MPRFKRICVIGGAEDETNKEFRSAASDLGRAIAARKIDLVYGGGIRGLQGWVAASAIKMGSKVMGVTLANGNTSNITYGDEIKVQSRYERLGTMFLHADALIVLPGDLETLEQIVAMIFWAHRGFPQKPIGFLSINGFYDHFLFFLEQAVEQKFMTMEIRRIIVAGTTADQLFERWQYPLIERTPVTNQKIQCKDDGEPDTTLRL